MSECQKMRLWVQDRGLSGCLVAIAIDEAAARRLMASHWNYKSNGTLEAFDLDAGLKYVAIGDL
jgi:hypothetical protein